VSAQEPDADEPMPPQPNIAAPQQPYVAPQQNPPRLLTVNPEAERLERSGRTMKAGGAFMLALGIAMELSGDAMTLYSQFADAPSQCASYHGSGTCPDDHRKDLLIGGVVSGLVGGGLSYGGLAVMAAGRGRIYRARALRFQPVLGARDVGARLSLTF
jgi:hypothetical protein